MFMEEALDLPLRDVLSRMQDRVMSATTYHGVKTLKNPLDFWVYTELIFERRPDVVLEIGNNWGGSTLALAHQLDIMGHGRVIAVDMDHSRIADSVRDHPGITFIEQPALEAVDAVGQLIADGERVLIIEDSAHTYDNTLGVLRAYGRFVEPDGWFIVEDSICHHGLDLGPNPGPYEAVQTFLAEQDDFVADRTREDFFITWNPNGFLKKVR